MPVSRLKASIVFGFGQLCPTSIFHNADGVSPNLDDIALRVTLSFWRAFRNTCPIFISWSYESNGAQATANANSEMIMNAINGTDADVRLLATTLNSDIDSVRLAINTVQGAVQQVGSTVGLTGQQVINAIQQGDAALASQLCQCCCQTQQQIAAQGYENQLRTVEQTNTLGNAITFSGQRNVDAIADLKTTMVKEFCDLKERDMQEKINSLTASNSLLRSQIDNAAQTATIAGLIAPVAKEVDDIKCRMPQTVPVQWPQLTAVNTTPYVSGGFYGNGWNNFGFGNNGLYF